MLDLDLGIWKLDSSLEIQLPNRELGGVGELFGSNKERNVLDNRFELLLDCICIGRRTHAYELVR